MQHDAHAHTEVKERRRFAQWYARNTQGPQGRALTTNSDRRRSRCDPPNGV